MIVIISRYVDLIVEMLYGALFIERHKNVESTNGEIAALEKAERELVEIEKERDLAKKVSFLYSLVLFFLFLFSCPLSGLKQLIIFSSPLLLLFL